MIILIDFGSQTAHLISRRVKELGVAIETVQPEEALEEIKNKNPRGIILSGGPASVYAKEAPSIEEEVFELGIPILGICYGLQLTAHTLGAAVVPKIKREYGPAEIKLEEEIPIFTDLPKTFTVWMSHGDSVTKLPEGFKQAASATSGTNTVAAAANLQKHIYGIQFHPEVTHTQHGAKILENFVCGVCGCSKKERDINVEKLVQTAKKQVGDKKAICAVSGGVDSTVAATLVGKAVGKNLIPIFVDNGLMRKGEVEEVRRALNTLGIKLKVIKAKKLFLDRLKGVTDPERKRKIIGMVFIDIFTNEAKKLNADFLVQGTIYSDVIESKGTKNSANIKSHHNVGGLPKSLRLTIIEPLRDYYKDEVREIGRCLGLPPSIVERQVFPGPGLAVRIIGEITLKRLKMVKQADAIVREEIEKRGLNKDLWMYFAILTGVRTTGVMGDERTYGETAALRIIKSKDAMTATPARIPYEALEKISSRIVNEVPGITRVVYDITTKPPATMEWE